jgi:hypothetical protein
MNDMMMVVQALTTIFGVCILSGLKLPEFIIVMIALDIISGTDTIFFIKLKYSTDFSHNIFMIKHLSRYCCN